MTEIILYIADQQRSTAFYSQLLNMEPRLNVPGMTEFQISDSLILGLMPEKGIEKLLGDAVPKASSGSGIPRCELYLFTADPDEMLQTAVAAGAFKISKAVERDWGHTVAYCADPDGHILAFAKITGK
jgi:uncharacterized glyoxalase superfamily protein PhnB